MTTGRSRNSLVNNFSKGSGMGKLPAVPPTSAVGYGAQTAQLQLSLFQQLAQIAAQKSQLQGQFQEARAGIKSQERTSMGDAESNALGRGIVGSSSDLSNRVGVRASAAAGISQALEARNTGLLGLQSSRLDAQNAYYTNLFNILAQRRAEQAQMAVSGFQQDQVLRKQDESGTITQQSSAPVYTPPVTDPSVLQHQLHPGSDGNVYGPGGAVKRG